MFHVQLHVKCQNGSHIFYWSLFLLNLYSFFHILYTFIHGILIDLDLLTVLKEISFNIMHIIVVFEVLDLLRGL